MGHNIIVYGCILALIISSKDIPAQPQTLSVGIIVDDQILPEQLPPHMRRIHPIITDDLTRHVRNLLEATGRCDSKNLSETRASKSHQPAEYILVSTLHKSGKSYRNRVHYFREGDVFQAVVQPQINQDFPYEVVSEPGVSIQLAMSLKNAENRVIWSSVTDSTSILPYDNQVFLYNTDRYPGITHPELLHRYHAGLTRLRFSTPQVDRMLSVSDRWFVSDPKKDLESLRFLLKGVVASNFQELDGHLPLIGSILAIKPTKKKDKPELTVGIGYNHGAIPKLRLNVRKGGINGDKIGEIELIHVDSTKSIAKTRKIDKKLRKRGEGFQLSDCVISKKRRSSRIWAP